MNLGFWESGTSASEDLEEEWEKAGYHDMTSFVSGVHAKMCPAAHFIPFLSPVLRVGYSNVRVSAPLYPYCALPSRDSEVLNCMKIRYAK